MIAIAKLTVAGITKDQRYLVLGSQGNFIKIRLNDQRIGLRHKKAFITTIEGGIGR